MSEIEGEVVCDVQDLPAPEPMQLVLEAVAKLRTGEYVRMMHRMEPRPLYSVLEDMGFDCQLHLEGEAPYEIMIYRKEDQEAQERVNVRCG